MKFFLLLFVFFVVSVTVRAQDSSNEVNLGSTITGNQEQPKVLYIVPWKQARDDTILDQSLESRLSDVFDHLERDEHLRELDYFQTLSEQSE